MTLRSLATAFAGAGLLFASWAAQAQSTQPRPLPEPEMWALVGLAAAIGAVVSRNKRK